MTNLASGQIEQVSLDRKTSERLSVTAAVSKTPAVEIDNLCKKFGNVTALDKLSFAVKKGELFFLLGPSGCGKTTLLRILAGLETADSGKILRNGQDISALPPHSRAMPMVFQSYALWPHLSVFDNVAFGLVEQKIPRKEIKERVETVLESVELTGLGARLPAQLSGGQQQRVVLARALVLQPEVVLLDEPLSNLDAKLRLEMRAEIERLHRDTGLTLIYVTHDQSEALSLADRMVVMNSGQVAGIGSPKLLYHRPPNLFTADFLGEANLLPATITSIAADGLVTIRLADNINWSALWTSNEPAVAGKDVVALVRPESWISTEQSSDPLGMNHLDAVVLRQRMTGAVTVTTYKSKSINQELQQLSLTTPGVSGKTGLATKLYVPVNHTIALPKV